MLAESSGIESTTVMPMLAESSGIISTTGMPMLAESSGIESTTGMPAQGVYSRPKILAGPVAGKVDQFILPEAYGAYGVSESSESKKERTHIILSKPPESSFEAYYLKGMPESLLGARRIRDDFGNGEELIHLRSGRKAMGDNDSSEPVLEAFPIIGLAANGPGIGQGKAAAQAVEAISAKRMLGGDFGDGEVGKLKPGKPAIRRV